MSDEKVKFVLVGAYALAAKTPSSKVLTLVFTALKGSNSLKAEKVDETAGVLIARHREHVKRLAATDGGRIIDWAGDGCFLTFETPSAAVLFALHLQQFHQREKDLPQVYAGINMGEVTEHEGPDVKNGPPRVEGLAVDTAARIQSLALPGQILMTDASKTPHVVLADFGIVYHQNAKHKAKIAWAHEQAMPEIQKLMEAEDYPAAYDLSKKAQAVIPDDPIAPYPPSCSTGNMT